MVDFALTFPPGFLWGTATSAHQVEGGLTRSAWAAWEKQPGRVAQNATAGRACEWWSGRCEEDFDRAASLHNNALRLSIEWSRVEPEPGRIEWGALARYGAMLGALRQRNLEPFVTLHHFSEPLWVAQGGGWTNPDTARHFGDFVEVVAQELGHLATYWCTINEPTLYALHSYVLGRFPPGGAHPRHVFRALENLVRGHARAYYTLKEAQPDAQVGLVHQPISPLAPRPAWLVAPARLFIEQAFNRAVIDALTIGVLRLPLRSVEIAAARDTLDWVGLSTGTRYPMGLHPLKGRHLFIQPSRRPPGEVSVEGLLAQARWIARRTGVPIYVIESGVPTDDDALRRLILVRSVRSVWKATMHSLPVRGYFFNSLVDSFEWAEGWDPRFRSGLFGCDPTTQQRTRRPSAELYAAIARTNSLTSDMARAALPDAFDTLFPAPPVQQSVEWIPR